MPHLVPLSFLWTDERILLSTSVSAPTTQNLLRSLAAHVALGHTRMWCGSIASSTCSARPARSTPRPATPSQTRQASIPGRCAATRSCGCGPRIRAWREEDELADRDVMADGLLAPCAGRRLGC